MHVVSDMQCSKLYISGCGVRCTCTLYMNQKREKYKKKQRLNEYNFCFSSHTGRGDILCQ